MSMHMDPEQDPDRPFQPDEQKAMVLFINRKRKELL